MSIKTAYISKLGSDYKISANFELHEMQCKDGSDKVLYSTELMTMLEKLRAYGGFTITIISGYRTKSWNAEKNGATNSQHLYGTAADILVQKNGKAVSGKLICCLAQTLGFKGIGYVSETSTHVDMRSSGTYRGNENASSTRDYSNNVGNDFYSYFSISKSKVTALKIADTSAGNEDEDMTQDQFDAMMDNYMKRLAAKEPADWSKEERAWAESAGLIKGDTEGNKQYKAFCTREQMITFMYRLKNLLNK